MLTSGHLCLPRCLDPLHNPITRNDSATGFELLSQPIGISSRQLCGRGHAELFQALLHGRADALDTGEVSGARLGCW